MIKLSNEAREYLRSFLADPVEQWIKDGRGGEPMPASWTELHNLTIRL